MILQKFTRNGKDDTRNEQYFTLNKIDGKRKNPETFVASGFPVWCGRWDLNPYVVQHTPLKRACLPIPALPHIHFVHQRCNVYIIRNPSGFVNPFFEKKFPARGGRGVRRPPHPGNIQPSLGFSFALSAASRATSSACRSRCGTGTPSSTAFSKIESDSLTI